MQQYCCYGGITTGCNQSDETDNEFNWSIPLESNNPIINNRIGNIGFKFCLLNEDSISANVFKKDKNFYFYFTIENFSEEEITIDGKSFSTNLFLIYDGEQGNLIGKPYSGHFCLFSGEPLLVSIKGKESKVIILAWIADYGERWPEVYNNLYINTVNKSYPYCCGQENPLLSKGIHSCRFGIDLQYRIGGKTRDEYGFIIDGIEKIIKELFFEINFKIE